MTTASNFKAVPFRHNHLLQLLCGLFLIAFAVSAYRPVMAADWWVENALVFAFVGFLIVTYRWLTLSQLSYVLIFFYLCLHEAGAHYIYGNVPLGEWMKPLFHVARNDYDRVVHFSFGLLLGYPQREVLLRKLGISPRWAAYLTIWMMLGYGAMYEELEAIAAVTLRPETADAFLGLQGDPWDTHKDMFMGFLGTVTSMAIIEIQSWRNLRRAHVLAAEASESSFSSPRSR